MRRTPRSLVPLVVLLAVVAALTGCGSLGGDAGNDGNGDVSTTASTATTATSAATSTTIDPAAARRVQVFYVRGEDLATGSAIVALPAVGREAVEALLAGPTQDDANAGLTSMVPAGTRLLDLDVADGTATVDLSGEFVSGGGSLSMQLRTGQLVFTLTQFPTVERVHILIDGAEVDGLGGEGLATTYDGREAFADVTPAILAETPAPGQVVRSPITVTGMANTFEATFRWSLRTGDGELLDEGTATATAGTGTWGTFSFEAETDAREQNVVVTLWEESQEGDGRMTNTYEVPIVLG